MVCKVKFGAKIFLRTVLLTKNFKHELPIGKKCKLYVTGNPTCILKSLFRYITRFLISLSPFPVVFVEGRRLLLKRLKRPPEAYMRGLMIQENP